jgi:hypothetical protein
MVRLRGWGLGSGGESGYWLYNILQSQLGKSPDPRSDSFLPEIRSCPDRSDKRGELEISGSRACRHQISSKITSVQSPWRCLNKATARAASQDSQPEVTDRRSLGRPASSSPSRAFTGLMELRALRAR